MYRSFFYMPVRMLLLVALLITMFPMISAHGATSPTALSDYSAINSLFQRQSMIVTINGKNKRWNGWKNKDRYLITADQLTDLGIVLKKKNTDQIELTNQSVTLTINTKKKNGLLNQKRKVNQIPLWIDNNRYVFDAKWIANTMGVRWSPSSESSERVELRLPTEGVALSFGGITAGQTITSDRIQLSIIIEPFQLRDYHLYPVNVPNEGYVQLTLINQTTGNMIQRNAYQKNIVIGGLSNGTYQLSGSVMQNDQTPFTPLTNATTTFTVSYVATPKPTVAPTPVVTTKPSATVGQVNTSTPSPTALSASPSPTSSTTSENSSSPTPNASPTASGTFDSRPTPNPADIFAEMQKAREAQEAQLRKEQEEKERKAKAEEALRLAEIEKKRIEALANASMIDITGTKLSKDPDGSIDIIKGDDGTIAFSTQSIMGGVDSVYEFKNTTSTEIVMNVVHPPDEPIERVIKPGETMLIQFKKGGFEMYTINILLGEGQVVSVVGIIM